MKIASALALSLAAVSAPSPPAAFAASSSAPPAPAATAAPTASASASAAASASSASAPAFTAAPASPAAPASAPASPAASAAPPASAAAPELAGCWYGHALLHGRSSPIALGLAAEGEELRATLHIPAIGVDGLAVGTAAVEPGVVKAGPGFVLTRSGEDRLDGVLPPAIEPVDEIPVAFRRTPWRDADCGRRQEPASLTPLWTAELGAGVWSDPCHDAERDRIILGTLDGRVIALDAGSGRVEWAVEGGGSIRSAPWLRDGRVLVASDDGMLRALSAGDGALRWETRVGAALDPPFQEVPGADYHYRGHQLLPVDGKLLAGTLDGVLLAIDPGSGEETGRVRLDGAITALASAPDGGILAATWAGSLYSLSPGLVERWRFAARGAIHGGLLAGPDGIVFGDRGYYIHSLRPATGAPAWSRKLWFSWVESAPVLRDGMLFIGSSDSGTVRSLDPASGAGLWVAKVGGRALAPPAPGESFLVQGVSGQRGYISRLDAALVVLDPVTGDELVRRPLPSGERGHSGVVARPLVLGDVILFADVAGRAYACRLDRRVP